MQMFDIIRAQMAASVPFAKHTGVALLEIGAGTAVAQLEQSADSVNHIGSQHAGALFTLGETASGGAMSGAFAEMIMSIRPVAAAAEIRYLKIAKGTVTARAKTATPPEDLLAVLKAARKATFDVDVVMSAEDGTDVATMRVVWDVRSR